MCTDTSHGLFQFSVDLGQLISFESVIKKMKGSDPHPFKVFSNWLAFLPWPFPRSLSPLGGECRGGRRGVQVHTHRHRTFFLYCLSPTVPKLEVVDLPVKENVRNLGFLNALPQEGPRAWCLHVLGMRCLVCPHSNIAW